MIALYSALFGAALVLTAPVWVWRMLRQGRYREGLRERLGVVRPALAAAAQGRQTIWFHAVSVGETMAAVPLIAALERALPGALLLLSTTTPTGQAVARERLGADRVFFYPLDAAFAVRPWLRTLGPALLVLMESELWPRMLSECVRAGVPVAVVNARVSDRSLPRYLALRRLWTSLLAKVSLLLAQSATDRDRWLAIGAPPERTGFAGNLKYDVPLADHTPLVQLLLRSLPPGVPVLVAGSTHPGEDELLLACNEVAHVLVLAPRHPQRAEHVALLATAAGRTPTLLTTWRLAPRALSPADVLIVDTVGELAGLYALATLAFVGGSLVPNGGHNPLEPARFSVPVIVGPHTENFRDIVATMQAAGALRSVTPQTVCAEIAHSLRTTTTIAQAAATQRVFEQHAGATQRTVDALMHLLQGPRS